MAKLIALALAFAAFVALASAHTTIITTTIEEDNPVGKQQCSQQLQGQRLNQCEQYLQQGQSRYEPYSRQGGQMQGGVQLCCQELQNVDEQCQCEAVKEAFRQAQKEQQRQQGGSFGSQMLKQLKQKAQELPNLCKLQSRQCQIGTISMTTTTTITEENRSGSQMCQHIRGRRFDQCQSYVQRKISGSSGSPLLMSVTKTGSSQLCCNELQNVEQECRCQAMQEIYRQAQQMEQQWRQQGGSQTKTRELQQVVQNLRNKCNLQVQQCQIPSAMF